MTPRPNFLHLVVFAATSIWLSHPSPVLAQAQKIDVEVQVGFAGKYKVGEWTPVSVTLRGPSVTGVLQLEVSDGDDVACIVSSRISIDGRPKQLFVRFGNAYDSLKVRFTPEGGRPLPVWEFDSGKEGDRYLPAALLSSQELIVMAGSDVGMTSVARQTGFRMGEEMKLARLETAAQLQQLPTRWYGYEGVDFLVLLIRKDGLYDNFSKEDARWKAISQWVKNGGRLILFAGGRTSDLKVTFEKMGPVGELVPGKLQDDVMRFSLDALEKFSVRQEAAGRLLLPLSDPEDSGSRRGLLVPRLTDIQGAVLVDQGNVPLIVRAPVGFGEVTFVALDFNHSLFSRWGGRLACLNKLLGKPKKIVDESDAEARTGQFSYLGVTDLAGQLKGALDQFAGVSLVPFVLVAVLALGYIVLIGPVDYWLVKKVFRRPELTWLTFPLMVAAVSFAAYELAYWLKGDQLRINQVDLVDVDLSSGYVRGQTWFNIFSPDSRAYDVALRRSWPEDSRSGADADSNSESSASSLNPTEDRYGMIISSMGLPGPALGGMNRRGASTLIAMNYKFSPNHDEMLGVPIQVWSSKSFTARWSGNLGNSAKRGLPLVLNAGKTRTKTLTNKLGFPLRDCLMAWPSETGEVVAVRIPRLESGVPFNLPDEDDLKNLEAELKSFQQENARQYDPSSFHLPSILYMMTFYNHKPAGASERKPFGEKYARLLNRYQGHVDLSHILNPGLRRKRAILVGFADRSAAQVRLKDARGREIRSSEDGQDKHLVCFRFVMDMTSSE